MEQAKRLAASWARSFLAACLATYLSVGWDQKAILASGVAAVAPVIIRWLNPKDAIGGVRR
jgi:hypothetical protein